MSKLIISDLLELENLDGQELNVVGGAVAAGGAVADYDDAAVSQVAVSGSEHPRRVYGYGYGGNDGSVDTMSEVIFPKRRKKRR